MIKNQRNNTFVVFSRLVLVTKCWMELSGSSLDVLEGRGDLFFAVIVINHSMNRLKFLLTCIPAEEADQGIAILPPPSYGSISKDMA